MPDQQIKIQGHHLSDPSLERFFQVDDVPLPADELRKKKGITSGVLIRVTVKPGLPLGRFPPTIHLNTNLTEDSEVVLSLSGSVGDVFLVGPGWSSETGVWDIGAADGGKVTQRRLVLLVRGPNAKDMKFKVARVDPGFLKVKLGETTVEDSELSKTELLIEIPDSKALGKNAPASYMGGENGKLGEILLETTRPPLHSLRIRVRFAVPGGK